MKIKKSRFFIDYEKEEKWINEMAEKGYILVDISFGTYIFEENQEHKYIYRMEKISLKPESEEYKEYIKSIQLEEIELVAKNGYWHYFRKDNDGIDFKVYVNRENRLYHHRAVSNIYLAIGFLNFIIAMTSFRFIGANFWGMIYGTITVLCGIVALYMLKEYWVSYRKVIECLKER